MNAPNAIRKGKVCQIAHRMPVRMGELYVMLVLVAANAIERKKEKIRTEIIMMPKKTIGPL
jgi:hypothetical protein